MLCFAVDQLKCSLVGDPNKAPICRYVSPSLRRACAASRDSAAACALAFCYFALPEHFCYVLFGLFRQHKRHLELRIVVVVHDSDEIFSHWLDIVKSFGLVDRSIAGT